MLLIHRKSYIHKPIALSSGVPLEIFRKRLLTSSKKRQFPRHRFDLVYRSFGKNVQKNVTQNFVIIKRHSDADRYNHSMTINNTFKASNLLERHFSIVRAERFSFIDQQRNRVLNVLTSRKESEVGFEYREKSISKNKVFNRQVFNGVLFNFKKENKSWKRGAREGRGDVSNHSKNNVPYGALNTSLDVVYRIPQVSIKSASERDNTQPVIHQERPEINIRQISQQVIRDLKTSQRVNLERRGLL